MSVESSRRVAKVVPERSAESPVRWPDLGRADVGMLLTSRWKVTAVDAPRKAAERAAQAWSQSSTPAGLLASNVFISSDDRKLVRISQWRDDEAGGSGPPPPPSTAAPARGRGIVPISEPTVEHLGTRVYRPYRSGTYRAPDEEPGALFVVDLDMGGAGQAQEWVELIFAAIETQGHPPDGLMAGHFYVSDDGRRAVNLAEWVSAEAHAKAVSDEGGFMGASPAWEKVRAFVGGRVTVENYRFFRSTAHVV